MYVLCRVPDDIGGVPVADAQHAAAELLDSFNIAAVPFSTPPHEYLRFSCMYADDELEALRRIGPDLALQHRGANS
jgi:hypothetical protein